MPFQYSNPNHKQQKKRRRLLQVTDISVSKQIRDLTRLRENLRPIKGRKTPAAPRLIEQPELAIGGAAEDGKREQRQARSDLRVRRVGEAAHSLVPESLEIRIAGARHGSDGARNRAGR